MRIYNKKKVLILVILIPSVAIVVYFVIIGLNDMIFNKQIEREVKTLYSASKDMS